MRLTFFNNTILFCCLCHELNSVLLELNCTVRCYITIAVVEEPGTTFMFSVGDVRYQVTQVCRRYFH